MYSEIAKRQLPLSGRVPQISIMLGKSAGGAVYAPVTTDFEDVAALQGTVDRWTSLYAATSEMHEPAAFAEVPPQSARVALAYVSPATRTDPRIQGLSFFYTVPGDSGFLPGMSMLAFLASDRSITGLSVPEDAVVHWQGAAWIYRAVGPDAFARHRLKADPPMSADAFSGVNVLMR